MARPPPPPLAADRGAYIDKSQSFNVFMTEPNYAKLSSMHFYGWKKGLKTGMYYLRTRAAVDAIKFTVDQTALKAKAEADKAAPGSPKSSSRMRDASTQSPMKPDVSANEGPGECLSCGA